MSRPLKAGTRITEDDLTYKRPGTGISPLYWDKLLEMHVLRDLEEDHILQDLKDMKQQQKVVALIQARMGSKASSKDDENAWFASHNLLVLKRVSKAKLLIKSY